MFSCDMVWSILKINLIVKFNLLLIAIYSQKICSSHIMHCNTIHMVNYIKLLLDYTEMGLVFSKYNLPLLNFPQEKCFIT